MEAIYSKALGFGLLLLASYLIYYFRSQYNKDSNNYSTLSIAEGAGIVIIMISIGLILLFGNVNIFGEESIPNSPDHNLTILTPMDSPLPHLA